jgi:hypothetical protein
VISTHGSPQDQPGRWPRGDRHWLDTAGAEGLLAGWHPGPEAPVGEQALADLLAAARAPVTPRELAEEAAYVATFVMAATPGGARGAMRRKPRHTSRRLARLAVAAAAAVVAAGGTAAFAGVLPPRIQEVAHVTIGAPAPHRGGSHPSRVPTPSAHPGNRDGDPAGQPSSQPGAEPPAAPPGKANGHAATPPGQAKRHKGNPPGQTKGPDGNRPGQRNGRDGTPPGQANGQEGTPGQVQG